ncbi:MAG: hypothetical protein ACOYLE_07355 [Bacteroidales bacterium]
MENYSNKDWSNLPTHKPDVDLWERIDTELDLESVSNNLDQLPEYSPKLSLWNSINLKLSFYQYLNYFYVAGVGIIAIAMFFVFTNKSNNTVKTQQAVKLQNELTTKLNKITKQEIVSIAPTAKVSDKNNTIANAESKENKDDILKLTKAESEKLSAKQTNNTLLPKLAIAKSIIKPIIDNQITKPVLTEKKQVVNEQVTEKNNSTKVNTNAEQISANPTNNDISNNLMVTEQKSIKNEESTSKPTIKSIDTNQKNTETTQNEVNGIDPKRVNLKSTNNPIKKGLYSIGVDYTFSKIYNQDKFSYSDNNTIGQYGISMKYNYSNWIFQTGVNYSRFSNQFNYNSDQQQVQFKSYTYVDSIIYNQQGNIIQYVTHPVTLRDTVLFQQTLKASKNYSLLNIPVMLAYQYGFGKVSVSLKAGVLCTLIISEKETISLPETPNLTVVKIYSDGYSINKVNWAGIISAEVDYHINKNWGVSVEPMMQYYFKPLYNGMDINSKSTNQSPYLIGVKTGLFYKF